jgi:hypothetical protein
MQRFFCFPSRLDIVKRGKDFKNIEITTMSEKAYASAIRNGRSVKNKRGPSSMLHMLHKRDVKNNEIPGAKDKKPSNTSPKPVVSKHETPKDLKTKDAATSSKDGKQAVVNGTTPTVTTTTAAGDDGTTKMKTSLSKFLPVDGSIRLYFTKESINVHVSDNLLCSSEVVGFVTV